MRVNKNAIVILRCGKRIPTYIIESLSSGAVTTSFGTFTPMGNSLVWIVDNAVVLEVVLEGLQTTAWQRYKYAARYNMARISPFWRKYGECWEMLGVALWESAVGLLCVAIFPAVWIISAASKVTWKTRVAWTKPVEFEAWMSKGKERN